MKIEDLKLNGDIIYETPIHLGIPSNVDHSMTTNERMRQKGDRGSG